MAKFSTIDKKFMNMAFDLAQQGAAKVFPNPMVGAVLVKNGKIIGKGWHKRFGGPHAEIYAIEQAGGKAKGADLYVTLEPCTHWGKTPPCADKIIEAGICRVIAASIDPNPKASGKGLAKLSKAGIKVERDLLRTRALHQNSAYFSRFRQNQSLVTVKAAMSLDGKICTRTGDSKWISNETSRKLVHTLRSQHDAVLVGINTVIHDNPWLTSHGMGKNPVRVIIDPDLRIPLTSHVLDNKAPTVIFSASKTKAKNSALKQLGIFVINQYGKSIIGFKHILKELSKMSIYSILIEGGGETIASAIDAGVVDKLKLFISPKIIGGRDAKTPVEGFGTTLVSKAKHVKNLTVRKIGNDLLVSGDLK